jgi:hypothetical protein
MRSLGEFFGHIARGVRTDPATASPAGKDTRTLKTTVEEERRDDGVVLRRTTIEEIQLPADRPPPKSSAPSE